MLSGCQFGAGNDDEINNVSARISDFNFSLISGITRGDKKAKITSYFEKSAVKKLRRDAVKFDNFRPRNVLINHGNGACSHASTVTFGNFFAMGMATEPKPAPKSTNV